jgi:hypothetical protein
MDVLTHCGEPDETGSKKIPVEQVSGQSGKRESIGRDLRIELLLFDRALSVATVSVRLLDATRISR